MAANTVTLRLDDGTEIFALVESDIEAPLADLLASGDELRLRADDIDVTGHATSEVVSLWVAGPDDVTGHALTLRLPTAQAARELNMKLIAGGALAVVIATGAVATQALPNVGTAGEGQTISTQAVHPGQTRQHLRTDTPAVAPVDVAPVDVAPAGPAPGDDRQVINRGPDKTLPGV